jgi:hypothetical protein
MNSRMKMHCYVLGVSWIQIFMPRHVNPYPGMKLHTQAWNFLPKHWTTYPCMKLLTLACNSITCYETSYPGMEIPTQARKFLTTPTSLPLWKSWRYDYTYENLRLLNRKDFIFFCQGCGAQQWKKAFIPRQKTRVGFEPTSFKIKNSSCRNSSITVL